MVFKFLFSVTGKLACIRFCGIFEWELLQFLGISFDLGFFFGANHVKMASRLPNMTELLHALPEPHRVIDVLKLKEFKSWRMEPLLKEAIFFTFQTKSPRLCQSPCYQSGQQVSTNCYGTCLLSSSKSLSLDLHRFLAQTSIANLELNLQTYRR